MKAVVLGGGGLTGRCSVHDLATGGVFDSVVVADLDMELATAAAKAAGSRASPISLDVRNKAAVVALLRGADVVVNAVQYTFNLAVMEAALEAHVPYLDFGGLFHTTLRQLAMDAAFRQAKTLAIPGLGQVPGISNVLAMQACEDLDRVDSVMVRDGWRDLTVGGPEISFTWSPSTFLDEMILPAQVFEGGAYREYPPMSGAEEFDFGPPVGKTRSTGPSTPNRPRSPKASVPRGSNTASGRREDRGSRSCARCRCSASARTRRSRSADRRSRPGVHARPPEARETARQPGRR